ncbi:hypothetical protein [Algoriphagus lutimaris]|uniref:hypothetical protein n=1 Tax=Algoriphagus lutimaris TaxID=613197 RepID=UPI001FAF2E71|nr:hypothetical protein [Algoriphagus lutimaris]
MTKFDLPPQLINVFHQEILEEKFNPAIELTSHVFDESNHTLFSLDLNQVLDWLQTHEYPKSLEKEPCQTPVLLYVPKFSLNHLLFHYDGTSDSARIIHKFLYLFQDLIKGSKATIISPSFIPKSRSKEEQEIIQKITSATMETSFIKFNFMRIGDFWSYAVQHDCTLLVTSKTYQQELSNVLFDFYKGNLWDDQLSFYLSL